MQNRSLIYVYYKKLQMEIKLKSRITCYFQKHILRFSVKSRKYNFYAVCMCVCVIYRQISIYPYVYTHTYIFLVVFFAVVRTLKNYSLCKFQVYETVLLTIITVLYSRSLELSHLITESLYPFNISHLLYSLLL